MNYIAIKVMLVTVALGAAVFALAGTANATHVSAVITVPDEVTVGQPMEVRAALRPADGGSSLEGISVAFYTDASFGGVTGEVELGRAVTDEDGVAALTFEPRSASEHQIRIEYLLPGESEPEEVTQSIFVIDGGTQLYRSSAGVDIPGLNVWLIIAVVSTVWLILLSVALR
ncbi:MAG: hypothetical protein V3S20_11220, partial [Dehalococcoidia bacterium]